MNTLLINTATPEAWVAVVQSNTIVVEKRWQANKALGQELLLAIDRVLAEAKLELNALENIAAHRGPGHYSALRTGILTAELLAQTIPTSLSHFATDDPRQALLTLELAAPDSTITPNYW